MTVVNGNGEKQALERGDDLLAGQASLGVLGVVLDFTIKVQDMSYCRVQNKFDTKFEVLLGSYIHGPSITNRNLNPPMCSIWLFTNPIFFCAGNLVPGCLMG